jgi:hypothetical protein
MDFFQGLCSLSFSSRQLSALAARPGNGIPFVLRHIQDKAFFGTRTIWRGQTRVPAGCRNRCVSRTVHPRPIRRRGRLRPSRHSLPTARTLHLSRRPNRTIRRAATAHLSFLALHPKARPVCRAFVFEPRVSCRSRAMGNAACCRLSDIKCPRPGDDVGTRGRGRPGRV